MAVKCYAVERSGSIHTLNRAGWPRGDYRAKWKWRACVDGVHWRFFVSKAEWEAALDHEYRPAVMGPYYQHTMRAVTWSEHEGRVMLERLQK